MFAADGTPIDGSDFLVSTANANNQINPQITALPDGGFVGDVAVRRQRTNFDIRGRVFDQFGVENAVTFDGGAGDDVFRSGAGNDIFNGGDDNDTAYYRVGDGRDMVDGGARHRPAEHHRHECGRNLQRQPDHAVGRRPCRHQYRERQWRRARRCWRATPNYEVATVDVEDIFIDTGAGNDVVIVTGSLNGTGLAQSTITVDTGAGNDTLDLRDRDSAHRVVADGRQRCVRDTVIYDFARSSVTSVTEIYGTDGVTVIGAAITHNIGGVSVTDEFTQFRELHLLRRHPRPDHGLQPGAGCGRRHALPRLFNTNSAAL